jgi:hypothetical protein
MEKIKFSDLSVGLKIPIIVAYVIGILYTIMFIYGFILALSGGV